MSFKETAPSAKTRSTGLGAVLLLQATGLGGVTALLVEVSRGSERALAFGLSAPSLALTSLTLLTALILLALGVRALRHQPPTEAMLRLLLRRPAWSLFLLSLLALAGWLTAWTPPERFGHFYYYALRLIPLAGWLAFAAASLAVVVLAAWRGIHPTQARAFAREHRPLGGITALILAVIAFLAWLATAHVPGMNPAEEDFWYGAGVPVLAWQVLAALLAAGAIWSVENRSARRRQAAVWVDVLLFGLLWLAAGLFWAQAPLQSNFTLSPPYPPNFAPYPAADSENYDLAAQYALIGQGLFDGGRMKIYFERPLYSAFLFYLHLLAGQDYAQILALQAFLYGVFPALAYLIGRELHSRALGVALAVLLTLRGWNGLALGGVIDTSTQKQLLTDFPTAIGLGLIIWLTLRWTRAPRERWPLAIWLGGVTGLGSFLRPHLLFFLFPVLMLTIVLFWRNKRTALLLAGLTFAAYLAAVLPWMQFNGSGMSLVSMYLWRAQAIFHERFEWPDPGGLTKPQPVASLTPLLPEPAEMPEKPLTAFVRDHFLNNLTQATLSLPLTLHNLELETLVRQTETFWRPYWDGRLSPSARLLLPLHLLVCALGVGLAWQRARWRGLFPLAAMLLYFLVNSLVRTSGGRYLVPADWVIFLYFLLGLTALGAWGAAWFGWLPEPPQIRRETAAPAPWHGLTALAAITALGAILPLTNVFSPPRYPPADSPTLAARLNDETLSALGISTEELHAFLVQPNAVLLEGRALYPRFIGRGLNPLIPGHLLTETPYSRMAFTLIGRHGHLPAVLVTGDGWFALPHTADVLVLGCLQDGMLNVWALFLSESDAAHARQPSAPLHCPLPEPVCDNNGWCR